MAKSDRLVRGVERSCRKVEKKRQRRVRRGGIVQQISGRARALLEQRNNFVEVLSSNNGPITVQINRDRGHCGNGPEVIRVGVSTHPIRGKPRSISLALPQKADRTPFFTTTVGETHIRTRDPKTRVLKTVKRAVKLAKRERERNKSG